MSTQSFDKTIAQLHWRAAVKSYNPDKKLGAEQLELLVEAARLAPTSFGLQPVKLYVVSNQEVREKLEKAGFGQPQFLQASHIFVLTARETLVEADVTAYVERTATQRSVEVASLEGFKKMLLHSISGKSDEDLFTWSAKQAYLVLGVLLATAAQNNIDATPMEGFSPGEFDEILGTKKDGYKTVVVMAAGFRAADDKYSTMPKVRKTKDEFVELVN